MNEKGGQTGILSQKLAETRRKVEEIERLRQEMKGSDGRPLETEDLFHTVFDRAGIGIGLVDLEGRFLNANLSMQRILGYSVGELRRMRFFDLTYPEDRKNEEGVFRKDRETEGPETYYEAEKRYVHKSGRIIHGELVATFVRDDQGRPRYGIGILKDVTARRQAEEELRRSEATLRTVFRTAPIGIGLVADGVIRWINDQVSTMTGFPREDLVGRSFAALYEDDSAFMGAEETRMRGMKGGSPGSFETRWRRRDGSFMDVYLSASDVDPSDRGAGFVFTAMDITPRKGYEKQLAESEERYRTAIENSNDGVAIVRGDVHVYVNKRFVEMFGFRNALEVLGTPVSTVVHPEDRARVLEINRMRQLSQPVPPRYTFKAVKVSGEALDVEVSASRTTYFGEPVSLVNLRDVSDRKNLESQLRQVQKMEAIGQLAGGIAHDFNNILTALIGYGNLLSMKMGSDDPLRIYVDQILNSSQKAVQLTHSLLAFSRKQVIELKPQKLNALVQAISKLLGRLLTEDIELKILLAPQDMVIMADVTQIDQVLMNLASNARDAMPQGGSLTIETSMAEIDGKLARDLGLDGTRGHALLTVKDTGAGIPEHLKEKIFEPFFTTKETGKGTGLGLSIVYGIVKQHDGYIRVESKPGEGTTFFVYLPVVRATPVEEQPFRVAPPRGSETILVAEDNRDVRRLTTGFLGEYGYRIVEAGDGEEAVDRFLANPGAIDLVLLDVVMPKRNGREVYEEITRVRPDVKVIFMSGYTADIMVDKGIENGRFTCMSKPVAPDELLRKIREVLDKP